MLRNLLKYIRSLLSLISLQPITIMLRNFSLHLLFILELSENIKMKRKK